MGEKYSNSEYSEDNNSELDLHAAELALLGFRRVKNEAKDSEAVDSENEEESLDDFEEDEGYDDEEVRLEDDYYDDEDDNYHEDDYDDDYDYYDDYEEEYYGEKRSEFSEDNLTLWEYALPEDILERYSFINELPKGVAVMGGVARSIAREIITGEREPIRDIDLVNILDEDRRSNVDYDTLDELSEKFMPDDFAFGHGIGSDTLRHYFETRDFTVNQSLIKDGKLIVSDFAYNDFKENIIRPTYYEHPYDEEAVSSRLFLKALMMKSVLAQTTESYPAIEDIRMPEDIEYFDIALFLNKAMSRGAETAREFTNNLVDWDIVSEEFLDCPVFLARSLAEDLGNFQFRQSTDKRFIDIAGCEDLDGYFMPIAMINYYSPNSVIRQAMAEYDGIEIEPGYNGGERMSGHYTQAEYDEINSAAQSA